MLYVVLECQNVTCFTIVHNLYYHQNVFEKFDNKRLFLEMKCGCVALNVFGTNPLSVVSQSIIMQNKYLYIRKAVLYFHLEIDDCAGTPCNGNGICVDGVRSHTCDCFPRYTGHNCETGISLHLLNSDINLIYRFL